VRPDTEARFEQQGDQYVEIPTIPSNLQQVFDNLEQFARRLDKIDVESLVEAYTKLGQNADQLVQNVDKVVADPKVEELLASVTRAAAEAEQTLRVARGKVGPITGEMSAAVVDARETLERIRALVESAERIVRPDSPLRYQVSNVLSELQNTARALRSLADTLDRDPQALITGKNPLEP
jgi:paraquat-inducible protein B